MASFIHHVSLSLSGKELKALMSKHVGDSAEPGLEDKDEAETSLVKPAKGEEKTGSRPTTPSKSTKGERCSVLCKYQLLSW